MNMSIYERIFQTSPTHILRHDDHFEALGLTGASDLWGNGKKENIMPLSRKLMAWLVRQRMESPGRGTDMY